MWSKPNRNFVPCASSNKAISACSNQKHSLVQKVSVMRNWHLSSAHVCDNPCSKQSSTSGVYAPINNISVEKTIRFLLMHELVKISDYRANFDSINRKNK